jgi:hypothetical protein
MMEVGDPIKHGVCKAQEFKKPKRGEVVGMVARLKRGVQRRLKIRMA